MNSKIKYVDANGLRIFAEELKQQLKNHVMETGIFNTIANRVEKLENLEIFEICQELPEKGMENKIYLVDDQSSSSGFTMYIWVDNDWKNKGAFETTFDLKNYVFEKGTSENSIVLKGSDNKVGLKGYYISGIKKDVIEEPYGKLTIAISDVSGELVDNVDTLLNYNIQHTYNKGDIASFQLGNIFTNIGEIIDVNANIIQVKLNKEITLGDQDPELRHYFWVGSKWYDGVIDLGQYAVSFGTDNKSLAFAAYTEGWENSAYGKYSHVEGKQNEAHYCSHAEGSNNKAFGNTSHVEGTDNIASNSNAHAEGRYTTASGYASHAEGYGENVNNRTVASGDGSHAEGRYTIASGKWSHAEGEKSKAIGLAAHAEGLQTVAEGQSSHAEGRYTYAKGVQSHAEGYGKQDGSTGAFGAYSHSEGQYTTASGAKSHSEGTETNASADSAHAEGLRTIANGRYSHAEGRNTITNNDAEHASGQYNKSTKSDDKAEATHFSIGIGTSDSENGRKNAIEVKQNGDVYITGIGGFTGANSDSSKSVQEVINKLVNKFNERTTND